VIAVLSGKSGGTWRSRLFLPSTVVSQEGMNDSLSENEDYSRIELQCNRILILREEPTCKIR
jgi:hypothetical protein